MRFTTLLLLSTTLLIVSGCGSGANKQVAADQQTAKPNTQAENHDARAGQFREQARLAGDSDSLGKDPAEATQTKVSLSQADKANAASQAIERKIIRDGNLTIEVASPTESQRKISSVAESHGGFVVTSEMTQQTADDKSKPEMSVNLVVRVPAAQFDKAMEEIRAVASRVVQEKRTGNDVTEEFIDLEARMKNQKALETQFLEIMKRAGKVEDALEVQRQLADVRTEIERLEGRKRFLENQSSLSTINVTLQTPTQIVNAAGFWYSIRSAFADGVDVAGAIILFLIRAVIALLPILVLIVSPAALIAKFVVRRVQSRRPPKQDAEEVNAKE
jgi:Domain of unknown function (DUF4349)